MFGRKAPSGLERRACPRFEFVTGMTVEKFAAPPRRCRPAPSPSGEPVGQAQPCRAGMERCDKRPAVSSHDARRRCRAPGVPAGVRGRRFAPAARNAR